MDTSLLVLLTLLQGMGCVLHQRFLLEKEVLLLVLIRRIKKIFGCRVIFTITVNMIINSSSSSKALRAIYNIFNRLSIRSLGIVSFSHQIGKCIFVYVSLMIGNIYNLSQLLNDMIRFYDSAIIIFLKFSIKKF